MTASTPPLVDVITGVLAGHSYATVEIVDDVIMFQCACGACTPTKETIHRNTRAFLAAHQARAVLDALEQAGGVEWGVLSFGRPDGPMSEQEARKINFTFGRPIIWRTKAGPWAAVEG